MEGQNGNLIEFDGFRLDPQKKILWRGADVVSLPGKSIELLSALVENRGQVVGKDALMEIVWPNSFVEESVLTQNIYLLRKTLEKVGGGKNTIKNVPRRGYFFSGEVSEAHRSEILFERHVVEHIQIEQTIGDADNHAGPEEATLSGFSPPDRRWTLSRKLSVALTALVLSAAGVGGYFYLRPALRQGLASPPPVKLHADSSLSREKSLVVLPMQGPDIAFSNSFTRDISVRLGALNRFRITPHYLVQEYQQNAAEVNAEYILTGDVESVRNSFRAEVAMRSQASGKELWSEKFESDNFAQLQDAVTNKAAKILLDQLSPDEREQTIKRLPTNLSAHESFLNGYMLWRRRADGTAYLKKAVELDQSYAAAYAILAHAVAMKNPKGFDGSVKEAETLLQKAFDLDPNLADAYAVQGFIRIFYYRDWAGAEKALNTALDLDANNVNAHHWLGVYYSIHSRLDEAKTSMQKALFLDPTNPTLLADIGQIHYFAGEPDLALEYYNKALALYPEHPFANDYISDTKNPQPIRDEELTLAELRLKAEIGFFNVLYLNVDPRYESIRKKPGFQKILRTLKLDE